MPSADTGLIFDLGMSEGNDTAFYLSKGFRVVGVEADPSIYPSLLSRFAKELSSGQLVVENKVASKLAGQEVDFFVDSHSQGHSSISNPHSKLSNQLALHKVSTTSWGELKARYGIPYYLKIDIEGAEDEFLEGMAGEETYPTFISAECMNFQPIERFRTLGYNRFRLVNQLKNSQFAVPSPPLEGKLVARPDPSHWSGFFGRELPGKKTFSFEEIREVYDLLHKLWSYETITVGWLDCHAWRE